VRRQDTVDRKKDHESEKIEKTRKRIMAGTLESWEAERNELGVSSEEGKPR
jgi:hypothetical protein